MYLSSSSGSRGTSGSASTDQSSDQRLNAIAGRSAIWASAWRSGRFSSAKTRRDCRTSPRSRRDAQVLSMTCPPTALFGKSHRFGDRGGDCGALENLGAPARHGLKFVEARVDRLMTPQPSEVGYVCDAIRVSSAKPPMPEPIIDQTQDLLDL